MKYVRLFGSLLAMMLILTNSTSGSANFVDETVVFDKYDFDYQWSNATEEVIVWTNSTPMFTSGQDQVTLTYHLQRSDQPVEVSTSFLTMDVFDTGATWLVSSFAVGNLKEGSRISLSINWKSLLDEESLDDNIYDGNYTIHRQYQIVIQLFTSATIWEQESIVDISASASDRVTDLGPSHFKLDTSEAIFSNGTSSEDTQTSEDVPLHLVLFPATLSMMAILRRFRQ